MSGVILIRHAMPEVVPGVSSKLWGLSEASREDCVLLAHALPAGIAAIWTSDERKARETADVLALRVGLPLMIDARFAEVDRPDVWDRDYRDMAAGYLRGVDEPGWEQRTAVAERFDAGIEAATAGATGDVVIVNHGLAMTLWLASVTQLESVTWWRSLSFPDAWRFDPRGGSLEHVWMGGTPAK